MNAERRHERYVHIGQRVTWWRRSGGELVCAACHPSRAGVLAVPLPAPDGGPWHGELCGVESEFVVWGCDHLHPDEAGALRCARAELNRRARRRRVATKRPRARSATPIPAGADLGAGGHRSGAAAAAVARHEIQPSSPPEVRLAPTQL